MNNNVEELNYQLFLENVGDIKEIKEREACKMQEKLENEKDLELDATNLSQNDSISEETINSIVPQSIVNDNSSEAYDPFGVIYENDNINTNDIPEEPTDLEIAFQRTALSYDYSKSNIAEVQSSKHRKIAEKNMDVIDLELKVFFDESTYKKESISFFFNDNQYCVDASIKKLKELTNSFGVELKQEHCRSFTTIIDVLDQFQGTWVRVQPTARIEKVVGQPDKEYVNFEVIEILGKNHDLGGNIND